MKRSDSIEYRVSAHFLSALINHDFTALTDAEEFQLEEFEYQVQCDAPEGFEFGHFSTPAEYTEDFGPCEICDLQSQVVPVTAIYWSKEA